MHDVPPRHVQSPLCILFQNAERRRAKRAVFDARFRLLNLRLMMYIRRMVHSAPMAAGQESARRGGRTLLNCDQNHRRTFVRAALALMCLASMAATAFAQESTKATGKKWRPKDGTYVGPYHNYNRCRDLGDVIVELTGKSIRGSEWSCKITGLGYDPDAIRLDMIYSGYNPRGLCRGPEPLRTAVQGNHAAPKMQKSMLVRKTLNSKFTAPQWASYCPDEDQRLYTRQERGQGGKPRARSPEKVEPEPLAPAGRLSRPQVRISMIDA